MDRRQVVKGLGATAALASYGAAARAQSAIRQRRNINTLTAAEISAFRQGVQRMKQRSSLNRHDPLGWVYWHSIHWTDDQPPAGLGSIYRQCDHSTIDRTYIARHFLSWHRAYLYYFEHALRTAVQETTGSSFDLPYWDWYSQPALPISFREGNQSTNPLGTIVKANPAR